MKGRVSVLKIYILAFGVGLLLSGVGAFSDDKDCKDGRCHSVKPNCFNVFCSYRKEHEGGGTHCDAAVTFVHGVGEDGREIWGNSEQGNNPAFEVKCDGKVIYNGSAHRYTDRLGSRIQGIPGPFPAVVLPGGALNEMRHYSESTLELHDDAWDETMEGYCYIYSGPSLFVSNELDHF